MGTIKGGSWGGYICCLELLVKIIKAGTKKKNS